MKLLIISSIALFLSFGNNIKGQGVCDTVYFYSYFKLMIKSIEVKNVSNGKSIIIDSKAGRNKTLLPMILDNRTDSIKVTVKYRFRIKNDVSYLLESEIEHKYIYIWVHRRQIIYQSGDRLKGKI
ncbi:hypothetical protein SDC9_65779 [bioreactor metagenome]|uniref:Uncharacterized protein n=1 Tax=bioreactor metagenome TaxID=1076179 RepID=A0A644XT07_9ZZZZ